MSMLLKPEEISDVSGVVFAGRDDPEYKKYLAVAKAQLSRVFEWGNEKCPHYMPGNEYFIKRHCDKCWQALKDS